MSTRAIVGMKNADGSIRGMWIWNDGMGLKQLLVKNFHTIDEINSLIELGMINCLYTEKAAKELDEWRRDNHIVKEGEWISFRKARAYREFRHIEREPEVYANMEEARGQDINYLYLYDPETNSWEVIK